MRFSTLILPLLVIISSAGLPSATIADPPTGAAGYAHSGNHTYQVSVSSESFSTIGASGVDLSLQIGDDGETDVSIGFSFDLMGSTFTDLQVNGNGHVYLGTGYDPAVNYLGGANPNSAHPESNGGSMPANYSGPLIAFGWDDLDVSESGEILAETRGVAPNREFVVEFSDVKLYGGSTPQAFQLVLRETTNEILMIYESHDATRNGVAIGIQLDDQTYLQYGYFPTIASPGFPGDDEALRFVPAGGGGGNPFGGKHALVIGIDGVRSDALQAADTPSIDALIAIGAVSWEAFAGGQPSGPTNQATSSGPGWSSICTAVWVDKHGVTNNSFSGSDFGAYPHFFERIKAGYPTAFLSSIVQWHPINDQIVSGADFRQNVADSTQAVEDAAAAHLSTANPDVLFLHFDDVDHAGHGSGFSPANPAYIEAIETVDAAIGNVVAAILARPDQANEDWRVVITTDHGGVGTSHGGQSSDERTIWIVASGGSGCVGEIAPGPGHTAIPATVLEHLGAAVEPGWGWEAGAFGVAGCTSNALASEPSPPDGSPAESIQSTLSWQPGAGATSHDVYFGTDPTPDGTELRGNQTVTTFDPGPLAPATTYTWRIDEVSDQGTLTGDPWSFTTAASIADDLVLHLPFDGTTLDISGRGNHASATGSPGFVGGRIGQGIEFDGTLQYVSVGAPADLQFGDDTDFSVSFWVKTDQLTSDPSILSNKNWASGSNTGWVVAAQSDGVHWQWNFKSSTAGRRDFENGGVINDDAWHHVAVTHDRAGAATFFHDGAPIGSASIAGSGTVDTGLPLAIGQDGTLAYPAGLNASLDDVGIWRRRLGASEVLEIHDKGRAGRDLQSSAVDLVPGVLDGQLSIDRSPVTPGDVLLSWPASCSAGATGYAVYEGEIGDFYRHTRLQCLDDPAIRTAGFTPSSGNRYYLVVALDGTSEGSHGLAFDQAQSSERPHPANPADRCRPAQDATACSP